ncbi:MAG: RNA-guided pseudouridylation complex pseudouridine synthase subunit Cbf5 [Thermoplasmatota archaeon]
MRTPVEDEGVVQIVSTGSDPRYGSSPWERDIQTLLRNGAVILDKPRGPTSHQVVGWLKSILEIDKAGHHGTLDPNTTGVLPVALGNGVRLLDLSLPEGKEYVTIMHLHRDLQMDHLRMVLDDFTGDIYQMVPVRSAVKRGLRQRRIEYIKLLEKEGNDLLLLIGCESGTYIRTLIHDMGEVLGVGANMSELRRTRSGRIGEDKAVTLQNLKDACEIFRETGSESRLREVVRPMEELLSNIPRVFIKDSTVDAICHGAQLGMPGICALDPEFRSGDIVAIMTLKGEAVAIGKAVMGSTQMQGSRKGAAVQTERVLMEPGTYPKAWKSSNG